MLDKKTFILGVLSLSAVVLIVANILAPRYATAADSTSNADYQLSTGRVQTGGEALYITDNRSGLMVVYVYNSNSRTLVPTAARPIQDSFQSRGPAGPGGRR